MLQDVSKLHRRIGEHIEHATRLRSATIEQSEGVLRVLAREDFPLHSNAPHAMGLLTAGAYEAGGGSDPVVQAGAGAAIELFIAASCILDAVMDEDTPPWSTTGIETAHGIALLLLAQTTLFDAAGRLPPPRLVELSTTVHRLLLASCAGQYEELLLASSGVPEGFTTDDALALTALKAGALGRLAGITGASLADADPDLVEIIGECCYHHATYRQVLDDLSDAPDIPGSTRKSDASRNKPTLPLVFLRNSPDRVDRGRTEHRHPPPIMGPGAVDPERLRDSGAQTFTAIVSEVLRNKTLALAEVVEQRTGRAGILSFLLGMTKHEYSESKGDRGESI